MVSKGCRDRTVSATCSTATQGATRQMTDVCFSADTLRAGGGAAAVRIAWGARPFTGA
jgi:hypothetical protein